MVPADSWASLSLLCQVTSVVSDSANSQTVAHSRGSFQHRDSTHISYVSCIGRQVLYHSHHLVSPLSHYMASNSPSHGDLRAAKRVEEETIKGLGALISNPSRMLPLLSIGQNKPQDYPRFKGRESRTHLLREEVQRYGLLGKRPPSDS